MGIENLDGTDGLQVVRDASYLANNLALMFYAEPEWLFSNNFQGTIFNGNSVGIILNFVTDDLELGDYSMDMEISTNDPVNSFVVVPVSYTHLDVYKRQTSKAGSVMVRSTMPEA